MISGSRVIPVAGDLRQPCFGLAVPQYDDLARQIDAIYHVGADVNFVRSYESVKPSTVAGTTEVLRLAGHGRAKPLHHVSSLAVSVAPSVDGGLGGAFPCYSGL